MDALCHDLEKRAATVLHCSPVPVGSLARRAVIAAGDIGRGALELARVRDLRAIVTEALGHGLIDVTAAVWLADAIDCPGDREARRGGLLELARHAGQWTETSEGVEEVALLRDRFAPECGDTLWERIVEAAQVAVRDVHDLEDKVAQANAEADLEYALAQALDGDARC